MTLKFPKIKVGIAEDHALLRSALIGLINENDDFEVVVEASNGSDLIDKLSDIDLVDVLLIDVEMPVLDGPNTVAAYRNHFGDNTIILGLSVHKEARLVMEMIEKGANGYITKGASSDELFEGMRKAIRTGYYLSHDIADYFKDNQAYEASKLTDKEEVILKLICREKTNEEIAQLLSISRHTVNTYRTRMIEKLKVKNTVGLVMYALKSGLCWIDEKE